MDSNVWNHRDPDPAPVDVPQAEVHFQPSMPLIDISRVGMPVNVSNFEQEDISVDEGLGMEIESQDGQVPPSCYNSPIEICCLIMAVPQIDPESEGQDDEDEDEPQLPIIEFKIIVDGGRGAEIANEIKEALNAPDFTTIGGPENVAYSQSVTIQVKWNRAVEQLFSSIIDAFYGIPYRPRLILDQELLVQEINDNQSHSIKTFELHSLYPDNSLRSRWVLPLQLNNELVAEIKFDSNELIIHSHNENQLILIEGLAEPNSSKNPDLSPGGPRLLQLTIGNLENKDLYGLLCGFHNASGNQLIYQMAQANRRMGPRSSSSEHWPP